VPANEATSQTASASQLSAATAPSSERPFVLPTSTSPVVRLPHAPLREPRPQTHAAATQPLLSVSVARARPTAPRTSKLAPSTGGSPSVPEPPHAPPAPVSGSQLVTPSGGGSPLPVVALLFALLLAWPVLSRWIRLVPELGPRPIAPFALERPG
jgi:hypothetical protein